MGALRWGLWAIVCMVIGCGGADFGSPPGVVPPAEAAFGPPPRATPEPALVAASPTPVAAAVDAEPFTDPGQLPSLEIVGGDPLPLEHTDVRASLSGFVADVEVTQTFHNPKETPIEAIYVFPLPENAAVYAMKMVIGARVIEAAVQERRAAARTYDEAKKKGHTAALLEQNRPDVFAQRVANIEPGSAIDVVIHYVQDLSYDAGTYEFVFPMTVGPRYFPGKRDPSVSPPYLAGHGLHEVSLDVLVNAEGIVSDVEVPTHAVLSDKKADGSLEVTLSDDDAIPNRDFVMRYRVAGAEPRATMYLSGEDEGYYSLVIQPPALEVNELIGEREIIFVVDVSGSMWGVPLTLCKSAMRAALAGLRPVDTFNVITFSGATEKLYATPQPANAAAISQAEAFLERMSAGGGTEMLDAVAAALSPDVAAGRHRYVFFLTDGYVGNEAQIVASTASFIAAMARKGQDARVFGFGVGAAPNRALMDGLAVEGRGLVVSASNREDPLRAVNRFYRYIDRTVLRDVTLDAVAVGASDMVPAQLPDVFASHPTIVHGRWKGRVEGMQVTLSAESAGGRVEIPVTLAKGPPILSRLWARAKVAWLEAGLGSDPHAAAEITAMGIEHHLVTRFTSLVAVDSSRKIGDGKPLPIIQAVELPEGVDPARSGAVGYEMASISASECKVTIDPLPNDPDALYNVPEVVPNERGCFCDMRGSREQGGGLGGGRWGVGLLFALLWRARRRATIRAGLRASGESRIR